MSIEELELLGKIEELEISGITDDDILELLEEAIAFTGDIHEAIVFLEENSEIPTKDIIRVVKTMD